jgi:hypothetical protein
MWPETLIPKTAVVGLEFNLPETIEGILRVLARTTTIVVVLESSREKRFWRLEAQREFRISVGIRDLMTGRPWPM